MTNKVYSSLLPNSLTEFITILLPQGLIGIFPSENTATSHTQNVRCNMSTTLSENNFDIKLKEHYKLYVLLKDKIIFESELEKSGIKYYVNINEQPSIDSGIRYFLLDSEMENVDRTVKEN